MYRLLWCFLLFFTVRLAHADGGPAFDLDGPRIQAKVTREGKTLPIGTVATLAPGDRLWVHPDLPEKEGARYVLVVAFLRGSVNPPPENWFTKAETWNKKIREEGLYVTVPEGAQQVLLFLAPETGGDFSTLRNAVRGRPGAFVRAAQDLHQASLDRARLDTYLAGVKTVDTGDPKVVEDQTKLLARSLNIKVDQQCFDKPTEQQAPCLVQNPDSLVLDNGRSQSVVQQLTGGSAGDMLAQMSYTQQAGGGYYSVYVGTVMDMAKILDSFHTAEYQYLPALAMPKGDTLALKLNNPPSFHKPQSVLVVGLPAVQGARVAGAACRRSQEHAVRTNQAPACCRWWARPMFLPPAMRMILFSGCRTRRARAWTFPRPRMRCRADLSWMHRHWRLRNCLPARPEPCTVIGVSIHLKGRAFIWPALIRNSGHWLPPTSMR